uniref:Uncharacterized protein n=1 Tax=Eutreptiella gymnastica TaxID=73025 RepID=A0A7S4FVX0_9EUGL
MLQQPAHPELSLFRCRESVSCVHPRRDAAPEGREGQNRVALTRSFTDPSAGGKRQNKRLAPWRCHALWKLDNFKRTYRWHQWYVRYIQCDCITECSWFLLSSGSDKNRSY